MRMRLLQAGGLLYCTLAYGANLQNSDLKLETTISVPNWAVGRASTDLFGFNPVTRTMYLADRTNHAVTVIDTASKRVIGQIPLSATTAVNQPLVAIDLQQLVVSDGVQSVLVWDLRAPMTSAPTVYTMPSTGPDGMDYDTINQTVYVVTDNAPYYLVGINLAQKAIVTQTLIPFSADLIKFNPIDGKIYIAMEDADHNNASAGIAVYDPATDTMSAPAMYKVGSICPGHGIDIDPVSDVAVMGCFQGTSNGNLGIDLKTGKFVVFTDVGGTDSIVFNPNEVADNMRKYGGFIPGIRPGKRTADHINEILTRITLVGALYLIIISFIPEWMITGIHLNHLYGPIGTFFERLPTWMTNGLGVNFYFGGTSLLIVVGVAMDTVTQIEAQLVMRHYDGFTPRSGRIRGRRTWS